MTLPWGVGGYCQNPSKRVIVPEMSSQVANRRLQELVVDGEVAANTRHLGGQYCRSKGSNNSEIEKRIAQVNAAWCEMGGFWTSEAPFVATRCAFIGSIQGAANSRLPSYVLTEGERRKLDSKLVGVLRCMMKGAAYDQSANRSMSNCQVYSHWRLLPIELELVVREVKWLQKIVRGGPAHEQLIGELFGRLKVGGLPLYAALGVGGKLEPRASPYAKRMVCNLDHFRELESAQDLC